MSKRIIELNLTNLLAEGGYTASLRLGSEAQSVNLIIDTGSSTLVVHESGYQAAKDTELKATTLAQEVNYGLGGWLGAVVHTRIHAGELAMANTPLALVHAEAEHTFLDADGIWGMAYHPLNRGYDLTTYLTSHGIDPASTFPWPFPDEAHPLVKQQLDDFKALLPQLPEEDVATCFTLMEERGLCANRFTLITRRSSIHVTAPDACANTLAADPLNQGLLILGSHEEDAAPNHSSAVDLKVVHDRYYNVNLKAVRWQNDIDIALPTAQAAHLCRGSSNAIVDSGASLICLPAVAFTPLMQRLWALLPDSKQLTAPFMGNISQIVAAQKQGIDSSQLKLDSWPRLELIFEGENGEDVCLGVDAPHYWQVNAPAHGKAVFKLMGQLPHWPAQSILGLPLFNPYRVVFRRDLGEQGIIRFIPHPS
ncbi:pepsin-like aspartic protease [Shewanella sp. FJAT-52076]|uniref:pepsin-like aspartic protease n=1 Tax=Shewanella sp. FJAT-52076 TaxID=2864202 RepID=UPI001C6568DF|nr:pepsin-like aspartic protease [Shewanella sp. FJAT-52076]QYJ76156.1 A1 family peptidase [Shewanella sp. FJAT-52076]